MLIQHCIVVDEIDNLISMLFQHQWSNVNPICIFNQSASIHCLADHVIESNLVLPAGNMSIPHFMHAHFRHETQGVDHDLMIYYLYLATSARILKHVHMYINHEKYLNMAHEPVT